MSQNPASPDYADGIANTGALIGVGRTILLAVPPADAVAACVHAVRLLAEMRPPPEGFKPLLRHLKGVCAEILKGLGDAADVEPSEDGEWALDLVEAYARVGLGAPGILHTIVEVCLRYVVMGDRMFARSARDVGGQRADVSDNDLLLALPAPVAAPPETVELATYVYEQLYNNMKAFADAEAARAAKAGRGGRA